MSKLDIIIPIYNEGNNIKLLLEEFQKKLKIKYKILICYDFDNETGLKFLPKNDQKIIFVKNNGIGPNEAIKSGLNKSTSEVVVIYMSDDFENISLLNEMYDHIDSGYDLVIPSGTLNKVNLSTQAL